MHDVWGEIPMMQPETLTKWFDATRQIEKTEKGHKWLRYSDKEYIRAIEQFVKVAPRTGADWASKLPIGEFVTP